jgi:thiamine-monophosphate kinase
MAGLYCKTIMADFKNILKFYFVTDDNANIFTPLDQVKTALGAGATMIQYRNKTFSTNQIQEAQEIRNICRLNRVPFIVNDNILLAKALDADGVHLGQTDENPALARSVLGPSAVIGLSVSNLCELQKADLSVCDYIGTGPAFKTETKADAKPVCGPGGLQAVARLSPLPVVAIGGINAANAKICFDHGAAGVAVISSISRALTPQAAASQIGRACGVAPRTVILAPWDDEFRLIAKLIRRAPNSRTVDRLLKVPPGDDAALLAPLNRPVITTDTQREDVHFKWAWQSPEAVGEKAVSVTLSDLAASFSAPISLFVNLTLSRHVSEACVRALYQGINRALDRYDCALGGGNICGGKDFALDLFAVGEGWDDIFPARSTAQAGYGLYCTGPLGLARGGLLSLMNKDEAFAGLIARFKYPCARFAAARVLWASGVTCVIDVSDGLAGDARHIAQASGVSIDLDLEAAPLDSELVSFCTKYDHTPQEMILCGGEDYELLFACSRQQYETVKKQLPGVYPVGRCLPFNGRHLINLSKTISSFQHGRP